MSEPVPTPTAEQVLYIANGCETLDLNQIVFCVITAGSRHHIHGGQIRTADEPNYWPFQRGELLALAEPWGREPVGEGRKPAKWDVATYETRDFTAANALSQLIRGDEHLPPGWYDWDGSAWTRRADQTADGDPDGVAALVGVSPGLWWKGGALVDPRGGADA